MTTSKARAGRKVKVKDAQGETPCQHHMHALTPDMQGSDGIRITVVIGTLLCCHCQKVFQMVRTTATPEETARTYAGCGPGVTVGFMEAAPKLHLATAIPRRE